MSPRPWIRVAVPASTARAVERGHPWVYREGQDALPPGTPVQVEHRGKVVGWGLADEGDIAVRVLGTEEQASTDLGPLIAERIERADRLRDRMLAPVTDAWRCVNGAGDGLPDLVIDRYGEVAIVRLYAKAWEPWLDVIVKAVERRPWCTSIGRRLGVQRVDGSDGLVALTSAPVPELVVVEEHGMRLLVRPHTGQKTGMFLDQREHRALVGRWAAGRSVANLFAYHGGFSVAAALGGAAQVTTVDIAPEAIADAKENFRLNGLEVNAYGFEVADAFAWRPQGRLDLLVLDPPTLARDKRSADAARQAYMRLHTHHGAHIVRDGLFVTSSCTAWVGPETWRSAVAEGVGKVGAWSWLSFDEGTVDHPVPTGFDEGRYLKLGVLRRLR